MTNRTTRLMAVNAVIAAVYAALTVALAPISYGAIQFRISEALIFLAFYNKKFIPGLVAGCFIANLGSSLGLPDIIFGTFATLLAVVSMSLLHNRYLAALAGALFNGIIVGIELTIIFKDAPLWFNMGAVFIGELVVLVLAAIGAGLLEKNKTFMKRVTSF